jgi:hypothetical protein
MASKTWTSQGDFEGLTLSHIDTTTTPGSAQVEAGYTSGTITCPAYEAVDWTHWTVYRVPGTRPAGTIYYFRFKTATTEGGLAGASWSEYLNGVDENGTIIFDLRTWTRNNTAWAVGPWIEWELTLETS